jgi:hypothetical protein
MSIAFTSGVGNGSDGNGLGDLALLPQTATRDTFGPAQVLHHGADLATAPERGNADGWPSWSPDGQWIAFQHGVPNPILTGFFTPAALYVIAPSGGAPTRLDAAMGGASARDSYSPAFAPYQTAEGAGHSYAWVVFHSTRDYGNQAAGTQGTQRPQLWVAAVRLPIAAGTDPSCVPYWLSGQSITGENIAPTWAPGACLPTGAACTGLSQCCSGSCATDPDHPDQMTCQVPTGMCRARGQSCGGNGDCCAGLSCTGNVCDLPPG